MGGAHADAGASLGGEFLPDDEIPATLAPVFRAIFAEFWPNLAGIQAEARRALPEVPQGRGFPHSLSMIEFPMAGRTYCRLVTPFSLWIAQRPLDAYRLAPADQRRVDEWLASVGGAQAMQLRIEPRLKCMALHVAPESPG